MSVYQISGNLNISAIQTLDSFGLFHAGEDLPSSSSPVRSLMSFSSFSLEYSKLPLQAILKTSSTLSFRGSLENSVLTASQTGRLIFFFFANFSRLKSLLFSNQQSSSLSFSPLAPAKYINRQSFFLSIIVTIQGSSASFSKSLLNFLPNLSTFKRGGWKVEWSGISPQLISRNFLSWG